MDEVLQGTFNQFLAQQQERDSIEDAILQARVKKIGMGGPVPGQVALDWNFTYYPLVASEMM
jgi:hypothetical protein